MDSSSGITRWADRNLSIEFYDYQRRALCDQSQVKIYRWGRRTGKDLILAVEILYYMDNPRELGGDYMPKVLVLASCKSSVKDFFRVLRGLIAPNPRLAGKVFIDRPSYPQTIQFGSMADTPTSCAQVKGYASDSVRLCLRGEEADLVVLVEPAYIAQDVYHDVVLPICFTRLETKVVAAGTPSENTGVLDLLSGDFPGALVQRVSSLARPDTNGKALRAEFRDNKELWNREILAL